MFDRCAAHSYSKFRLKKGDKHLDSTFTNSNPPHHIPESLSDITYYIYSARRTPVEVLRSVVRQNFHAREYPNSFRRFYEWSPDECIPEFFTAPEFLVSMHEPSVMEDLELPSWTPTPEAFIRWHRSKLDADEVAVNLHHWIDLTFGVALSGDEAVKRKNVVLGCQETDETGVDLLNKRPGFVQLFTEPHPRAQRSVPSDDAVSSVHPDNQLGRDLGSRGPKVSVAAAESSDALAPDDDAAQALKPIPLQRVGSSSRGPPPMPPDVGEPAKSQSTDADAPISTQQHPEQQHHLPAHVVSSPRGNQGDGSALIGHISAPIHCATPFNQLEEYQHLLSFVDRNAGVLEGKFSPEHVLASLQNTGLGAGSAGSSNDDRSNFARATSFEELAKKDLFAVAVIICMVLSSTGRAPLDHCPQHVIDVFLERQRQGDSEASHQQLFGYLLRRQRGHHLSEPLLVAVTGLMTGTLSAADVVGCKNAGQTPPHQQHALKLSSFVRAPIFPAYFHDLHVCLSRLVTSRSWSVRLQRTKEAMSWILSLPDDAVQIALPHITLLWACGTRGGGGGAKEITGFPTPDIHLGALQLFGYARCCDFAIAPLKSSLYCSSARLHCYECSGGL